MLSIRSKFFINSFIIIILFWNLQIITTGGYDINENKELSIWEALVPLIILIGLLAFNVSIYGDDALSGSNQFILLIGGAIAAIVGFKNKITYLVVSKIY